MYLYVKELERIADAEVQGGVFPAEVVNPALALGAVGVVNLDTPVESQYHKRDVDAQTQTCVHTQLLIEFVEVEDTIGRHLRLVAAQIPDVTHIDERRTVKHSPNREAHFDVTLQSHIAHLYGVGRILGGGVTRAQRTGCPATHTVATADVEQSVKWQRARVAVWHSATGEDTSRECRPLAQDNLVAQAYVATHILRKSHA